MLEYLKNLFRENMLSCFYKEHFGVECPGCGTQRAILLLMEGDVVGSFKMYPPLIFVVITLVFLVIHLIFKIKKGGEILKYLALFTVTFMFFSYIYKVFSTTPTC